MRFNAKYLMVTVALMGLTGTAEAAYTYNNGTTVTSSGNAGPYQQPGNPATTQQGAPLQMVPQQMPSGATTQNMPADAPAVYTNGYTGPSTLDTASQGDINPATGMMMRPPIQSAAPVNSMQSMDMGGAGRNGVISDPQQIKSCLCMETQYEMMQNDVSTKQGAYSQATSQRAQLDAQMNTAKGMGQSDVNQIRSLSEQRIALQSQINQQYIPALQQATQRYNAAVGSFQQMCGGKSYDTDTLARVKTGLVCQGG